MRAALAASMVGLIGGVIASEYVGAKIFSIVTPALVGVACGMAAVAAARVPLRGPLYRWVRAVAVVYALIGTGYGFRFVPGGQSPFHPAGQVLPPYGGAILGAWLWTQPPRRRQKPVGRVTT